MGPTPHLGSIVQVTLLAGAWVSWPRGCEKGELILLSPHLPCSSIDEGKLPSSSYPSLPVIGVRAGLRDMSAGELVLPLTSCSARESGPST